MVGLEVVEIVVLGVGLVVVVLWVVVAVVVGLVVAVVRVGLEVVDFVLVAIGVVDLTMEIGVGVKSGASNSVSVIDSNAVRLRIVGIFGRGMLKVIKILRSSRILSAVKNGFVVELSSIGL